MYAAILCTPIPGINMRLVLQDGLLAELKFVHGMEPAVSLSISAQRVNHQLEAYFDDPATDFCMTDLGVGTEFQRRVWRCLRKIPVGATQRYGDIARKLHSSPRAVGAACRVNPLPIITPCHRVVSIAGIGGYCGQRAGMMISVKQWLLQHEQSV